MVYDPYYFGDDEYQYSEEEKLKAKKLMRRYDAYLTMMELRDLVDSKYKLEDSTYSDNPAEVIRRNMDKYDNLTSLGFKLDLLTGIFFKD